MGRSRKATIVVDLGFGDSGKGLLTDFLARERGASAVVRWNGGAQAGHNVVTPDGRHHTFSQLGAGSFVPGTHSYLTRDVVVHPTALAAEAERLARAGVADALDRLHVSESALVITPFQQAAGRLRELARGAARHGSCGVGVGEAVRDALADPGAALRVGALVRTADATLTRQLRELQARKRAELEDELAALCGDSLAARERELLEAPDVANVWLELARKALSRVTVQSDEALLRGIGAHARVVLEGAQGVLLDEHRGFHPYTTWSTCTVEPARALLAELFAPDDIEVIGVLRSYCTRHGAGPMPTANDHLTRTLPEPHNHDGNWQGPVRAGPLDLVLARYALAVSGGVDALAVTHLDALARVPEWQVCERYRLVEAMRADRALCTQREGTISALTPSATRDLEHQARLTRLLERVEPVLESAVDGRAPHADERFVALLEDRLERPVVTVSRGPRATEVRARER